MATENRTPPGGIGRRSEDDVVAGGIDTLRVHPSVSPTQASLRRRARFARSMVFEAFKYKHARAIDYDGFHDRRPNQAPRICGATT